MRTQKMKIEAKIENAVEFINSADSENIVEVADQALALIGFDNYKELNKDYYSYLRAAVNHLRRDKKYIRAQLLRQTKAGAFYSEQKTSRNVCYAMSYTEACEKGAKDLTESTISTIGKNGCAVFYSYAEAKKFGKPAHAYREYSYFQR